MLEVYFVDTGSGHMRAWSATLCAHAADVSAVAQGSPALFLDEPAAALDPRHQAELIRLVRRLVDGGRTVVIVCHDLNLPGLLAARVLAIKAGRIVLDADAGALGQGDQLREIFETEFAIAQDPGRAGPLIGLSV